LKQNIDETVAPLRNVSALLTLVDRVQTRDYGLPGMATFYGPSGWGKSSAATYTENELDALHIEVQPLWQAKALLTGIAEEMELNPRRSTSASEIYDMVSKALAKAQRPLLIDEADRLTRGDMIEVVRGLYEASNVPVILIGEEGLPLKLQQWERVHGRMLTWVAAEAASLSDVAQLAKIYARGITIDDALAEALLVGSKSSLRRVSTNLAEIKQLALREGWTRVGLAQWGKRTFFGGEAPPPRRTEALERVHQIAAARRAKAGGAR